MILQVPINLQVGNCRSMYVNLNKWQYKLPFFANNPYAKWHFLLFLTDKPRIRIHTPLLIYIKKETVTISCKKELNQTDWPIFISKHVIKMKRQTEMIRKWFLIWWQNSNLRAFHKVYIFTSNNVFPQQQSLLCSFLVCVW